MGRKSLSSALFWLVVNIRCQVALQADVFGALMWPSMAPPHIASKLEDGVTTIFGNSGGVGSAFAALKAGGEVVTWGDSGFGGDSSAVEARLRGNVTTIFSNSDLYGAFAALKAGGEVVTWGTGEFGGDSSHVEAKLRRNVMTVYSNAGSYGAFAALKAGGEVVTWGADDCGGDSSAVEAKLRGNVTTIFSSGGYEGGAFAALKIGGEVVTWGDSAFGGDSSAVADTLRGNVTTIFRSAGEDGNAFAALKAGGEVVTWGDSAFGGDSSAAEAKLRGNVTTIFSHGIGGEHRGAFAALKTGGEVVTWGDSAFGGDSSAVEAKLRGNVTTIFSSGGWKRAAFAALKANGEVVTWGDSGFGGDSSEVEAQLNGNVTTIFSNAGDYGAAFAALKTGGEVVTWGASDFGGDSSDVEATLRGNVTTFLSHAGEDAGAFAVLKAGGEVVTWGDSAFGGDSSAVEAQLNGNVTTIFSNAGWAHGAFAALKAGGEVVTWGASDFGGDSSAVEAKLRGNVTTVYSNGGSNGESDSGDFAALKTGGEVVIWGSNRHGSEKILPGRVISIIEFQGAFGALICIPLRASQTNPEDNCQLCSPNEIWTGVTYQCQKCKKQVEVPNANQSFCEPCRAGFIPDHDNAMCIQCLGNVFAEATSSECKTCPIGKVSNEDKSGCNFCASHQFAEGGICKSCPTRFQSNDAHFACIVDFWAIAMRISYIIWIFIFVKLLFEIFSRRFVVIDVSLKQGKSILTTLTNHSLSCPPYRPNFPIQLQGTGHYKLDSRHDSKSKVARAQVASRNTLELLDFKGKSINDRLDTSGGILLLTCADSLLHVSLLRIPLALPTSAIFLGTLVFAINILEAAEAGVLSSVAVLASSILWGFRKWRKSHDKTPLQKKLDEFQVCLSEINPKPTRCAIGPGRAIRLNKLLLTHDFFRTFIQDRTAYYLHENILMPLTAKYRLSYAELVGPDTLDFFVSHYWGTEFVDFCSSLKKHAETVAQPGSRIGLAQSKKSKSDELMTASEVIAAHSQRHLIAYWICFCSNNQYDVHNELGGDIGWHTSSFYLALQSPTCQCVCMVVDDKALPLTRSWCIFETLQALKLSQKRLGFDFLLCTASGVLNYGNASIEAAIGIAKGISRMDLQDAQASKEADKVMIDRLVLEEMGTFEKLNAFIRDEIRIILERAQETCLSEFEHLFMILDANKQMETLARASTSQHRSSSQSGEDAGQAKLGTVYGRSALEVGDVGPDGDLAEKWAEMCEKHAEAQKQMKEEREELEMKMAQMGMTAVHECHQLQRSHLAL